MKSIITRIQLDNWADEWHYWHLTDLHYGAAATNEKLLDKHIAEIKNDPHAIWSGGGDYIEAIGHKDPRFDAGMMADWVDPMRATQSQVHHTIDKLAPIMDKNVGLLIGNHEEKAHKYSSGFDAFYEICRGLAHSVDKEVGDVSLGVSGFALLRFVNPTIKSQPKIWTLPVGLHHGAGGAGVGLPGGYALKMGRFLNRHPSAHLFMAGHLHIMAGVTDVSWYLNSKGQPYTIERKGFYVPSYLESPVDKNDKATRGDPAKVGYAEMKGMPPTPIGSRPVTIVPSQHDFWMRY